MGIIAGVGCFNLRRDTGEVEPWLERVGAREEELHFLNGFHLLWQRRYPWDEITFNCIPLTHSRQKHVLSTYYVPVTLHYAGEIEMRQ